MNPTLPSTFWQWNKIWISMNLYFLYYGFIFIILKQIIKVIVLKWRILIIYDEREIFFKNELEEKSNVIQQIIEVLCFWNFAHILWNKSSQFSRVLKNWRNTHRTTPVHVVETLHIDQLLQNSFLHFGISVENFVMDWLHGSSVAMLRDEIKIIELGYNFVIDQSAETWIRNISVSREEFLFRMFVSSHKC